MLKRRWGSVLALGALAVATVGDIFRFTPTETEKATSARFDPFENINTVDATGKRNRDTKKRWRILPNDVGGTMRTMLGNLRIGGGTWADARHPLMRRHAQEGGAIIYA